MASSLLEVFSSGPKTRKLVMFWRMMSRRNWPSGRVFSAVTCAGLVDLDGVVAEIGHAQRLAQQPAVGVRVGAHAPRALRRQRFAARGSAARSRRTVPRACSCAASSSSCFRCAGLSCRPASGTWCDAPEAFDLVAVHFLRAGPALGPAQDDHRPARARRLAALARLAAGSRRISSTHSSSVAAIFWCISSGRRLRRSAASSRSP